MCNFFPFLIPSPFTLTPLHGPLLRLCQFSSSIPRTISKQKKKKKKSTSHDYQALYRPVSSPMPDSFQINTIPCSTGDGGSGDDENIRFLLPAPTSRSWGLAPFLSRLKPSMILKTVVIFGRFSKTKKKTSHSTSSKSGGKKGLNKKRLGSERLHPLGFDLIQESSILFKSTDLEVARLMILFLTEPVVPVYCSECRSFKRPEH